MTPEVGLHLAEGLLVGTSGPLTAGCACRGLSGLSPLCVSEGALLRYLWLQMPSPTVGLAFPKLMHVGGLLAFPPALEQAVPFAFVKAMASCTGRLLSCVPAP